jgi:hypothetical protein
MYFWKIDLLKEDIRNGSFGERETFIYILIYIGLNALAYEFMAYFPAYENAALIDHIESIAYILIPLIGTFLAYRANNGASGKNFAGKYFSISFVVSIRAMALIFPLVLAWLGYFYITSDLKESDSMSFMEIAVGLGIYSAIYWRIIANIKDVTNA